MRRTLALILLVGLIAAACGDDGGESAPAGESTTAEGVGRSRSEVVLVTHDSFALDEDLLAGFEEDTGITVRILQSGDAGAALNQAILTRDHPQGDVFFGVDNTLLTRALEADLFEPYEAAALDQVDDRFQLDPDHRVTPVDYGDVCLNYDRSFFAEAGSSVPQTLDDLADPAHRGQLVVENPATSSPGLAFLLSTVVRFGEDGWVEYWQRLRENDVSVAAGWEDAFYGQFSGGTSSEGDRPLVVSYASSPPAEVLFSETPIEEPPIGVITDGCFRQIELAGVLAGTERPDQAHQLIDFLLSKPVQESIPLTMFVFPVRTDAELPEVFAAHAVVPDEPLMLSPEEIGQHRDRWIDQWTDTVVR